MKRPLLPLIAMAVSLSMAAQTQWLDLTGGSIVSELTGTDSGYDTKFDGNTLTVTFSLSAVAMEECPEYPGTYTLNIDGFADNHTLGEPALPYIHDIFNIGASSDCSVEVLSATYRDYDIAVAPAYGDVYQYEQQRPIQPITATDLATEPIVKKAVMPINQSYLVDIKVNPVLYLSPTRVRVYDTIKYRITSDDTISNDLMAETKRYVDFGSPTSDDNGGIMPMSYPVNPYSPTGLYVENYVIVTTPKFESALTEFVNWKRTLGFNTSVICSPGEVWQSYDEVKAAVDAAHAKKGGIDYLLIVGDGDNVPPYAFKGIYNRTIRKDDNNQPIDTLYHDVHTDIHFAGISDKQILSTCYGRLPVKTAAEAKVVVDKIIRYESNPPTADSFYKKGIHACSVEKYLKGYQIEWSEVCLANNVQAGLDIERRYFRATSQDKVEIVVSESDKFGDIIEIEDFLKDPSYYERVNAYYSHVLTDDEIQQSSLNASINKGALFVWYFSHGDINRWGPPNYTAAHVRALKNYSLLPVVFSISCLTGRYIFDERENFSRGWDNNKTCFAYEFLVKKDGGCVGIYAATDELSFPVCESLDYTMTNALWPSSLLSEHSDKFRLKPVDKPIQRLGKLMLYALKNGGTTVGIANISKNYSTLHYFGDPSMRMYTAKPEPITGVSVSQLDRGGVYVLNVNSSNGEEYILRNDKTNEVYKCDGALKDISNYTTFDDYTLCITGDNRIPFVANVGELLKNNKSLSGTITGTQYYSSPQAVRVYHEVDQSKNGAPIKKVSVNVHDLAGNLLGSTTAPTNSGRTDVIIRGANGVLVVTLLVNDVVVDSKCITSN